MRSLIYFIFLAIATTSNLSAQNLTGTWEGIMGHEFLQVNIQDTKGKLCGYTYDHYVNDPAEHCRAYFKGRLVKERKVWIITGEQFIENSGTHVLMRIVLWKESRDGDELMAAVTVNSLMGRLFAPGDREPVILKRVSKKPQPLPGMPVCMPDPKKPVPPVKTTPPVPVIKPKPLPPKPVVKKPVDTIRKTETAPKIVDTLRRKTLPVVTTSPKTPELKKMTARKQTALSRLQVNVPHITLAVYDNGIIDGDTVSIFFNGKLLVNKQLLSAKPLTIELDLDESVRLNEIVMYAENLGSIPPNTALIVVTAGNKRYELHASASLTENALLAIEYKPEK